MMLRECIWREAKAVLMPEQTSLQALAQRDQVKIPVVGLCQQYQSSSCFVALQDSSGKG